MAVKEEGVEGILEGMWEKRFLYRLIDIIHTDLICCFVTLPYKQFLFCIVLHGVAFLCFAHGALINIIITIIHS